MKVKSPLASVLVMTIVAERGRLMQLACEQTTGGMAAVIGEERAAVAALCAEFGIEAANFNAPGQIIISGEKAKVEAARAGIVSGKIVVHDYMSNNSCK